MPVPNILLVGAGAVGQVYGYHLQRGGARVAYLVRPKAAAACERGMVLYALNSRGPRVPLRFAADAVFTSLDEVAKETWDEVWFCVPADAVEEAWLASIAAAVGQARIIALPPGLESEQKIRAAFPGRDVVAGLIGMVSYQTPLPGEVVPEPGIAFYFAPGVPTVFGGPLGKSVAAELKAGGCPAVAKPDAGTSSAFGSAILMPTVAGLEAAGWSLREFRRSDVPKLVVRAAREAVAITAAKVGVRGPGLLLLSAFTLRIAAWLAPKLVSFDLEAYLKHHFRKVGDQTRLMFGQYAKDGAAKGLKSEALAALLQRAEAASAD
jgi:2-dehydropantoate 2-reductase